MKSFPINYDFVNSFSIRVLFLGYFNLILLIQLIVIVMAVIVISIGIMNFGLIYYTQSPIIRNGPIRLGVEFWGKFKKRALGRSDLRNA